MKRGPLPACPYPVDYAHVQVGDRMTVSILGYQHLYRIAKVTQEPVWSEDEDRAPLEMRTVATTKSGLVVCLHTGNVLSWRQDGYERHPRSYFVGAPYRKGEKSSNTFAPGES